jgi:hypothetical protein
MADATVPAWTVTNQAETADIGPDGTYVQGVKVTFRTADGHTGSVFVPASMYNADQVRKMVADRASVVTAVAGLSG